MMTRTIILASLTMLMALPAWAGPLTPEHAWRQMQGQSSRRRVTMPRANRPLYTTPQVNTGRSRSKTKTVKPVTTQQQTKAKPAKKNGQGWLSKLKTKLTTRKAKAKTKDTTQAETTETKKAPRFQNTGRYMGLAKVKLTSLWSGMVGGIHNLFANYKQRREAAFNALYWRQPMMVPAGSPIPAEVLLGGMRLHKLQNYSQGTLGMLFRSGLVTGAEYRILTEARMGLPQMMQQMPQEAAQQAQPQMPPPPQQQLQGN